MSLAWQRFKAAQKASGKTFINAAPQPWVPVEFPSTEVADAHWAAIQDKALAPYLERHQQNFDQVLQLLDELAIGGGK